MNRAKQKGQQQAQSKKRTPSMHRYVATQRWIVNKEKKMKRHAKRIADKQWKINVRGMTAHGTARNGRKMLRAMQKMVLVNQIEAERQEKNRQTEERLAALRISLRDRYENLGLVKRNPNPILNHKPKTAHDHEVWEDFTRSVRAQNMKREVN